MEANNITIINADAAQVVDTLPEVDAFYIDPARRGESNKRVFALQDCEPNLPGLLPALLKRSPHVIAKLSPMADIQMTLELLPGTTLAGRHERLHRPRSLSASADRLLLPFIAVQYCR